MLLVDIVVFQFRHIKIWKRKIYQWNTEKKNVQIMYQSIEIEIFCFSS